MSNFDLNAKQRNKKIPKVWILLGVLGTCAMAFILPPLADKLKRKLTRQNTFIKVSDTDIELQIERRLRAEYESDYQAKLKDSLAKQAEKNVEETLTPPNEETNGTIGSTGGDVKKLRSGIPFHTTFDLTEGEIASSERKSNDSYMAHYSLKIKLPKPAKTISELRKTSPAIDKILPGLAKMLEQPKVSPLFKELYNNKIKRLRQDATNLNELISKHNFFDLETMLELQHPTSKRRAFLMQAEMDVVSDGSDGDRLPIMPNEIVNSSNYQPFTAYGWRKVSNTPNPMVAGWEKRIALGSEELAAITTSKERKAWLKDRIAYLKRGIDDMKLRSFLIAEHDPFIVIPVHILMANDIYTPKVGDYALVIHQENIYPCIVGDGGPTYKVGEASLRLAKAINSRATPYSRPESDLKVTYIVFPNSRDEKKVAPDYAVWSKKCTELLNEIGGLGADYKLFEWSNTLPPITQ